MARQPKTLVLATGADPKSFNDFVAQETSTTQVTGLVFEGLTRFNTETGEIEGRLAERWESSPDGLTWTCFLRQGVEWFDGEPFTARDVVFTFEELIYNPSLPSASRDIFTLEGKPIAVKALDAHTVEFRLPAPFAPFLLALGQAIYPRHVLARAVLEGRFASTWGVDADPSEIIGTGPFRLAWYLPGERIELVRNERYWQKDERGGPLPRLDRLIMLIVPSADGRLLKFLEGEIDTYALGGSDYPILKPRQTAGNFSLYEAGPATGSHFLVFNQNHKDPLKRAWFREKNFRLAVAHGMDRTAMLDIVFNRLGVPQCSPLSPSIPNFFNSKTACPEHDLDQARKLLSGLGLEDRDGDGTREDREGRELEFVLLTNAESPERLQMGGILREDLARLGFKVHFRPVEFNTLVTKLVATHDWDAALLGLTGELDPHFGANVWKSDGSLHFWNAGPGQSVTPWERRVDEIFARAARTLNRDERKRLYDEWQEIVSRELAMIYTVLPKVLYAVRNRFENLRPTVLGGPFHNIEWIDIRES